jgi:hypothetical protein
MDDKVKVVVMRRERKKVVNSFMAKTKGRNHWQTVKKRGKVSKDRNDPVWDPCFPSFPSSLAKSEAIGQYWDVYENYTLYLEYQYPDNVRVFATEEVFGKGHEDAQAGMLGWIGIPQKQHVLDTRIHANHILNPPQKE